MTNSKALEALKEIQKHNGQYYIPYDTFMDYINLIFHDLTELAEIKARAEEKKAELIGIEDSVRAKSDRTPTEIAEYFRTGEKVSIIDYILKGETK